MAPFFSIIIPIYNVEKYIDQCITSVLRQTFGDFEALCVDDCGNDNSMLVVEKYANVDKRIKILRHKKNRGLAAARNTALKAAQGKYIVCLDSDDWLELNALEYLKNEFEQRHVECILFDGYKYNDRMGVRLGDKICNNKSGYYEINPQNIVGVTDYSWIKAYTRDSILRNNINWPEGLTFEDGEFHMKYFALTNKIFVTSACLINYRIREGSIVTTARAGFGKIEHIYQVVKNVRKFYIERGLYDEYKYALLRLLSLRINTCRKVKNNYEKSLVLSKDLIQDFKYPDEFNEFKNDDAPIFSVLVPIYNSEKYIEKCIKSIQAQTFKKFELICVNDCTPDNSMKYVLDAARDDARIKIVSHTTNRGLGASRNTGISMARGKYCMFVDGDDWIAPDCLQKIYNIFSKYNYNTVWFKANIWWEQISKMTDMWIFKYFADYPEGELILNNDNLINFPLYTWNKAYKRDFLVKNNIKWTEGVVFEDVEFYFKLHIKSPKVYIINKPIYIYRRRENSIIDNCCKNYKSAENLFDVAYNVYKYLKENDLFDKYDRAFYKYSADAINMFRQYPDTEKALYPRIKKFIKQIGIKV